MAHLTRRERILVEVERRITEITQGAPEADPYQVTFSLVSRGAPLEGLHMAAGQYACSIIDTDESKNRKLQQSNNVLVAVIEFHVWVDDGEQPSTTLNKVLGDVQRKMREDAALTEPDDGRPLIDRQLTTDVEEVRNQLFIDGISDRKVSGAIFYNIAYKHGVNDPRIVV